MNQMQRALNKGLKDKILRTRCYPATAAPKLMLARKTCLSTLLFGIPRSCSWYARSSIIIYKHPRSRMHALAIRISVISVISVVIVVLLLLLIIIIIISIIIKKTKSPDWLQFTVIYPTHSGLLMASIACLLARKLSTAMIIGPVKRKTPRYTCPSTAQNLLIGLQLQVLRFEIAGLRTLCNFVMVLRMSMGFFDVETAVGCNFYTQHVQKDFCSWQ